MRTLLVRACGMVALSVVTRPTSAQGTDQAARQEIRDVVRSHLHLEANRFLAIQRDERLEQLLALAVGRPATVGFLYRVSQAGDEIKEHSVVHHIFTDADPTYILAVSPADGSTYRIHGFADSATEFEKLIAAEKVKVLGSDQAEAIADFYQEVNPQHISLTPITSLIELKQAAERQCQTSAFDAGEKAFDDWWKHAKPLYEDAQFRQTAALRGSGYLVEWIILSSAGSGECGGVPLRARLEISVDGKISNPTFSPLKRKGSSAN